MTDTTSARRDLTSYLRRAGWAPIEQGSVGQLWARELEGSIVSRLAVPYSIDRLSAEFQLILGRIAGLEQREASVVAAEVDREFADVQEFRIADAYVRDESVLLDSAHGVLASARKLMRAAATTARRPRPYIGSNYSTAGDEDASRARFSHTRRGSFIMPVLVPLEPVKPQQAELAHDMPPIEPSERRMTRTLASALIALENLVIRPDRSPTGDSLRDMVQSGVSKELVAAVSSIVALPGVQCLDTAFLWAPGFGAPGRLPRKIEIPAQARELLDDVERKLRTVQPEPEATVSGQIVQIRHYPGEPTGEIGILAQRGGRLAEVRIVAAETVIQRAYGWAQDRRAVVATGSVVRVPGRHLSMDEPSRIQPLDELFLPKLV